jgi:hypothetical protein
MSNVMELINQIYRPVEAENEVPFGNKTHKAIASWSDDYDIISAIEDDKCIVFILHSTKKPLQWIPSEIIKSLVIPLDTEILQMTN